MTRVEMVKVKDSSESALAMDNSWSRKALCVLTGEGNMLVEAPPTRAAWKMTVDEDFPVDTNKTVQPKRSSAPEETFDPSIRSSFKIVVVNYPRPLEISKVDNSNLSQEANYCCR